MMPCAFFAALMMFERYDDFPRARSMYVDGAALCFHAPRGGFMRSAFMMRKR